MIMIIREPENWLILKVIVIIISNLNDINMTILNYTWIWELINIKSNSNIISNLNIDINITKLNDNNDNDDTWTEW